MPLLGCKYSQHTLIFSAGINLLLKTGFLRFSGSGCFEVTWIHSIFGIKCQSRLPILALKGNAWKNTFKGLVALDIAIDKYGDGESMNACIEASDTRLQNLLPLIPSSL